jgi:hypothetical protein
MPIGETAMIVARCAAIAVQIARSRGSPARVARKAVDRKGVGAKDEDQREIVDRVPTVEAGAAHSVPVRTALVHTALVHTAAAGAIRATNEHSCRTVRIAAASASAVEASLDSSATGIRAAFVTVGPAVAIDRNGWLVLGPATVIIVEGTTRVGITVRVTGAEVRVSRDSR